MPHHLDINSIKTITDAMPGMIAYWDNHLICRFANKAYLKWFGRLPESLIGETMESLLGEQLFSINEQYVREVLAGRQQEFARTLIKADGDIGHTWAQYIPDIGVTGVVQGFFVLVTDISNLRAAEQRADNNTAQYQLLAENSTDVVFQLGRDLDRKYVSPSCREILGYEPEELLAGAPLNKFHPADVEDVKRVLKSIVDGSAEKSNVTSRILHRDGRWVWFETSVRVVRDTVTGAVIGIVGSMRDISARKTVEEQLELVNRGLEALARLDWLTGLPNRRTFDLTLENEYRRARRERTTLSLIMIDVDWFKAFNDRYGHPAGDECLKIVGKAIQSKVRRPGDLAARYGGEEFAVIMPDTSEIVATDIAEQIRKALLLSKLEHSASPTGLMTVSAGVASVAQFDGEPEHLVKLGDQALYSAKRGGRNVVVPASKLPPVAEVLPASGT